MDDVLSIKSNVTICLIELRESKDQSQELLKELKSWFAERKKKVCKEMAWDRALGVCLPFFFPQLLLPARSLLSTFFSNQGWCRRPVT
jgi:hypothetical protein